MSFADCEIAGTADGCRVRLTFVKSGWLAFLSSLLFGWMIHAYVDAEGHGLKMHAERDQ